ncbi:MAG: MFS transporter [Nanoarchaeota archaeon]|nr:MFS transporter [Nanoarchaeota archaeon]
MFALYLPFIVYYFLELGFSLGQIAILQSFMAITLFIFEIPSGYIADKFGRKNSLIVSVILQVVSLIILYSATSFFMLIVAHIVLGLAISFLSGADSAFLYDTLLVLKQEHNYKKIEGRASFYGEIAVITSALLGSLIIAFGIKYTILISLIGHVLLLFVAFSFKEPLKHEPIEKVPLKKEFVNLFSIMKRSLHNKKLLGIFIYSFVVLGISSTIFLFYQPYFKATNLPLYLYGVVFAIFSLFTALAALKVQDVEKKLGIFGSLLIMPVFLVISLIGASFVFVWYGFIFFFFRELVRGFVFPVLDDYVNKLTISNERATVLSVGSMFSRLGLVVISTTFGFLSDSHGIKTMLFVTGFVLLGFTLIIPIFIKNKFNNTKHPVS